MVNNDLYNYDEVVPEKIERWMRFDKSPELGTKIEHFELRDLDENLNSLDAILSQSLYTVVEFGSFT